jgi:hypothetical protein
MSLVAGCSLFNGVLVAADCRITFTLPNGRTEHADVAQKLFPVSPGTVLGFVSNDILVASFMIRILLAQVRTRRRQDAVSVMAWMPRLFRRLWHEWEQCTGRPPAHTAFMIGSVVPSLPNVVLRQDVVDVVNRFAFGNPAIRRNWLPRIIIPILETSPQVTHIRLNGTSAGLLYTMEPPHFVPVHHRPLTFTALGSGRGVVHNIERVHDWLVAGDVGNHFVEAMSFTEAIERFASDNNINSVGGLYPTFRVDGRLGGSMIEPFGSTREIPVGGARIELSYDNGQWVQRNLTRRREIPLVPPWRVHEFRAAGVFNDLDEACRRFASGQDE